MFFDTIEVEYKFDKSVVDALFNYHMKQFLIFSIVFCLFCCGCGVLFLTVLDEVEIAILLILFGILFPVIIYLIVKIINNKLYKTGKLVNDNTLNYFRFEEDKIYQKVTNENFTNEGECSYECIVKAVETKSHFFLYISGNQAHIIKKSDIIKGTEESLRQHLSNKLGKKFKGLKSKK